MDHTPSAGDELQSEYFVPREHAVEAFLALDGLRDRIAPLIQVSEVRTVAADDLWLSMASGRPSVALHFTWKPEWDAVSALLPSIETVLRPFEPRPHWGKLFTMEPGELRSRYERLPDFAHVAARHDPEGKFRNGFLDRYLGAP
jgi:xylitol oxidase